MYYVPDGTKECGYYEKVPVRNEQGTRIIRWESTVYEMPISLLTDFQEVDNQDKGNLYQENRERNNNYYNNKLNINQFIRVITREFIKDIIKK
mgnify:CR=1 FL=1